MYYTKGYDSLMSSLNLLMLSTDIISGRILILWWKEIGVGTVTIQLSAISHQLEGKISLQEELQQFSCRLSNTWGNLALKTIIWGLLTDSIL